MRFKNTTTGNILITDNKKTIKYMQESDRYVKLPDADAAAPKPAAATKSAAKKKTAE